MGLSETVIFGVPAVALIAVMGYLALQRLGWESSSLAGYGPIILGGGTALIAALWVVRGLAISGSG